MKGCAVNPCLGGILRVIGTFSRRSSLPSTNRLWASSSPALGGRLCTSAQLSTDDVLPIALSRRISCVVSSGRSMPAASGDSLTSWRCNKGKSSAVGSLLGRPGPAAASPDSASRRGAVHCGPAECRLSSFKRFRLPECAEIASCNSGTSLVSSVEAARITASSSSGSFKMPVPIEPSRPPSTSAASFIVRDPRARLRLNAFRTGLALGASAPS
mmetsp:Transcript_906/g.2189  ORF Transcript_906/g.2189 Transcript_906/m.2189 type:complete len:214 (+) Transcript_906:517-1158(+)